LSDTLAVSFSGALKRRDGIGDFVNLPSARYRVGELRERSGRLALAWRPAESFSLLLAVDDASGSNGMNPYTTGIDELPDGSLYQAGLRNADVGANPYDNFTGEADLVEKSNSAWGWSMTTEWQVAPGIAFKSIASKRRSDYRGGLDDDSALRDFLSFPEVGEAKQTSLEAQVSGERGTLDFVAGLWAFREEGFNDQSDAVFAGSPSTFRVSQKTASDAAYASFGYRFTPALRVSAGLRHTEDQKDARAELNDFVDAPAWRDFMHGEPAANARPYSELAARELLNFDFSYQPLDANWQVALYGRNVFDERYVHATLNTGDYILRILSNDASEFGVRASMEW